MSNRRSTTTGFSIEPVRAKPVAVASPSVQTRVIGSTIPLDGRGSSVSSGEELTYAWSFVSTPLGSTVVDLRGTESDSSAVTFTPDITGPYEIQLVVSTAYRSSDPVTVTVNIQAVLVSALVRNTPDADFFFRVLADFWQRIEDKQALSILWSGYSQIVACDLLRLFQVDYAKSIKNIQSLFQRRWLSYSPRIDLAPGSHWGVFGNHQSGSGAFTGSATSTATGIIISDREVVLMEGAPTLDAIGTDLRIYSGANASETSYLINRLNSDSSGYIVSVSTLFPDPTSDIIVSGTDLSTSSLSAEVISASVDFTAEDVIAGDVLRIESGADRGYYSVVTVTDNHLVLDRAPSSTYAGLTWTVFQSIRLTAQRSVSPLTNTVYIPQDEADLSVFTSSVLEGEATVQGPYEILLPSRHVLDAMVGNSITITTGGEDGDSGKSFVVAAVNASSTGYVTGSSMAGPYPATVTYKIAALFDISDRLLVLDGQAYEILSAVLDENQPSTEDGGRGPLWVLSLSEESVPAGRESLSWRIAATMVSDQFNDDADADLEEMGVRVGDKLNLRVIRTDLGRAASLPCQVLGVSGSRVSFDIGTTALSDGVNGAFSDAELIAIADDLGLPRIYTDDVTSTLQITLLAELVRQVITDGSFTAANYNLPVEATTEIDIGGYLTFRLAPDYLVRNSRILVDDDVASVPALFEYIAEPDVGMDDDGVIILVAKDATEVALTKEPVVLVENRDYSVGSEDGLSGRDGQTSADSGAVTLLYADLIDRDVHPRDTLTLLSGQDQADYTILEVTSSTTVRVMTSDGNLPANTATALSWSITRRTSGNFIRFVDGMFTAASCAPDRMWAETTFFDNASYIEDNFGVMVGLTKEQFDEYGSSQTSYKGAVSGLMYAWARGPALENVAVGAHILSGLPVTEVAGVITDIDDAYDTDKGRILIEDLDADGNGIGLIRMYFYRPAVDTVLDEFGGISDNLDTGTTFAIGDVVAPFTILSNAVKVTDYIETPDWWSVGGVTVGEGKELSKFHTWQLILDSGAVDSRDMPLICQFANAIRPIYTKPEVVLVVYLVDELQTDDYLAIQGTLYFTDDAAFSLQSTRMVDDYNDSLSLRRFDLGSFSTRSLFTGYDLETVDGSGVVTSARGGFTGIPTNPPNDYFPDHPMVAPANVATQLADAALPQNLVRAGDILYVMDGLNRGRYSISTVDTDTQLTVSRLQDADGNDYPPRSRDAAHIEAATSQIFHIEREDKNPIVSGDADTSAGAAFVSIPDGSLIWDGVAVGDELVILTGPDKGRHVIDLVVKNAVHLSNPLSTTATATPIRIEREVLRTNPILSGATANLSESAPRCVLSGGVLVAGVRKDDILVILSGPYANKRIRITGVVGDTQLWLQWDGGFPIPSLSGPLAVFEIVRPHLFTDSDDTDVSLENLGLYDQIEFTIFEPLELILTITDAEITGSVVSSGTDLGTAVSAVKVEFTDPASRYLPAEVVGMFDIAVMGQFAAGLEVEPGDTTLPLRAEFFRYELDFDINNNTVTSVSYFFEYIEGVGGVGVVAGDILEVPLLGEFLIAVVAGNQIGLAVSTGVTGLYTGRVVRRCLS